MNCWQPEGIKNDILASWNSYSLKYWVSKWAKNIFIAILGIFSKSHFCAQLCSWFIICYICSYINQTQTGENKPKTPLKKKVFGFQSTLNEMFEHTTNLDMGTDPSVEKL